MNEALAEVVVTLGGGRESAGWLWLGLIGGAVLGVLLVTVGRAALRTMREFARWRRGLIERLEWELAQDDERRRTQETESIKDLLARGHREAARSDARVRHAERRADVGRVRPTGYVEQVPPGLQARAEVWGGAAADAGRARHRLKLPPLPAPELTSVPGEVAGAARGNPAAPEAEEPERPGLRAGGSRGPGAGAARASDEHRAAKALGPREPVSPVGADPDRTTEWRVDLNAIRAQFAHEGGSG